jgi:hypothetical protein
MSTKIIERPATINFSKNELRYKFFTDNLVPGNLFVQAQLFARIGKTNTFLNWTLDEHQSPLIDNNLIIRVNGIAVVNAQTSGSGTLNLKAGDVVNVEQKKWSVWPSSDYYAKLLVVENTTDIYNHNNTDPTLFSSIDYTFTVNPNEIYSVYCYTRQHSVVPNTTTLPVPVMSTYTKLKKFNLKPNSDGNSYLYIDGWIDSLLKWVVPSLSDQFTNASEQTCEFYILFREVSAVTPDPVWEETELDHIRVALKGGIEKQKSSRNNYFLYQAANKLFFTWIPTGRFVYTDQHNFISVLIETAATYKLHVVITKVDGTTASTDISVALTAGRFYHLNISFSVLDLNTLSGGAPIHFYEVSLLDASDTLIYTPTKIFLEYRPLYENFELLYHNSLGGIDTGKVKGETVISIEKDVVELDGGMSITGWSDLVKTGESLQQSTKKDTYKGNFGFVHTKAHQEALQDLLISQSIFQYMDGRLVPVLNLQKNIELRKTSDRIYGMPIEWQLPFSNEVFTPVAVALGLGTDTETY